MKRNVGIDIAKIAAMFGVVFIHNLGNGGMLYVSNLSNFQFVWLWFMENIGITAVNIFAITTGFLMVERKIKFIRAWELVVQTKFWAIIAVVIFAILGIMDISLRDWLGGVLPVVLKQYWYVNAYLGMILFAPMINLAFDKLSQLYLTKILMGAVLLAITIGFIGKWYLLEGYSAAWLIILYFIGGYIKKYVDLSKIPAMRLSLLSLMMVVGSTAGELISHLYFNGRGLNFLISYVSPFVVIQSLAVFMIFSSVKVENKKIGVAFSKISTLTFGVYLIDTSIVYKYLHDKFIWMTNLNLIQMTLYLMFISIGLFLIFLLLEYIRTRIFDLIGVNKYVASTYNFGIRCFDKAAERLRR